MPTYLSKLLGRDTSAIISIISTGNTFHADNAKSLIKNILSLLASDQYSVEAYQRIYQAGKLAHLADNALKKLNKNNIKYMFNMQPTISLLLGNKFKSNLQDGLVAHYEFEGNANDTSGNNNHGTPYGNLTYSTGISGQAANFDGVNDYIDIFSSGELVSQDDFSLSAWLKPYSFSSNNCNQNVIFAQNDTSSGYVTHAVLFGADDDNSGPGIDDILTYDNWLPSGGWVTAENTLPLNEWKHIAVIKDGTSVSFYIDGQLDTQQTHLDPRTSASTIDNVLIGSRFYSGTTHCEYHGLIDELRIYDRALTANEVSDIFNLDDDTQTFGTVVSAGQIWMDRNLGASRVATSSTDTAAYGDLYQWGRGTDGHEKRNSSTTSAISTSDSPGHGLFILESSSPLDWRTPQNDNLWQGTTGTNNPCPTGFRLPTETELETERASWNSNDSAGAYGSPLKLVVTGYSDRLDGSVYDAGSHGLYWSNTVDGSNSRVLNFSSGIANMFSYARANGFSVRCIKD